MENNST